MKEIIMYTDGACSYNPGPGGWGVVLKYGEYEKELSGFSEETTNNRMEIFAAIQGLRALKEPCSITLFSDSAYLINAFQKGWIRNWQRNGWRNASKQPVENQDLWNQLLLSIGQHQIQWVKVKGHADNPYNNRCDQLARAQVTQYLKDRQTGQERLKNQVEEGN